MESNTNRSKFLLHAILTVTLLWIGSGFLIYYASDNWADRGTIGDMFGAVNALFSGLAFAGLMYTIILQREEIKLNRDEIVNNRKELAKSVKTQQKSQAALKQQVAQTHLTAKINAITTVINYHTSQIESSNTKPEIVDIARVKRRALIKQIDELIDGLEDSDVE